MAGPLYQAYIAEIYEAFLAKSTTAGRRDFLSAEDSAQIRIGAALSAKSFLQGMNDYHRRTIGDRPGKSDVLYRLGYNANAEVKLPQQVYNLPCFERIEYGYT